MGAMAQQEPLTLPGTGRHASRTLGRGSIVLLGSSNSLVGAPGMVSYTTAKHAIIGIMKSAGRSWLENKVFIVANHPYSR
jgi:NAD(P)-dependent dehydrogenase (short-subunit alcohol dehydrogenase family)